jgi:hypothetical protein
MIQQERIHQQYVEMVMEAPIPITQEEIVLVPTTINRHRRAWMDAAARRAGRIQQDRIHQQQVEVPVEVPVPMIQEDFAHVPTIIQQEGNHHFHVEEVDAGPRAQYVGRWGALMSDDEGDEGHEGDAGAPRHGGRGAGPCGAVDAGRSPAENFTKIVDALVFYIDWDNECKVAHANLPFDRDITNGRDMMEYVLTPTRGNNPDLGDVGYGKICGIHFPADFLRLFDGPSCNIMGLWHILGSDTSGAGLVVGTITGPTAALNTGFNQDMCDNECGAAHRAAVQHEAPPRQGLHPQRAHHEGDRTRPESFARADRLRHELLQRRRYASSYWAPSVSPGSWRRPALQHEAPPRPGLIHDAFLLKLKLLFFNAGIFRTRFRPLGPIDFEPLGLPHSH